MMKHYRVVCILPSANVEVPQFLASIDRGLVVLGRLAKITITVKDEARALPQLVNFLTDRDIKIRSMSQERAFLIDDLTAVSVRWDHFWSISLVPITNEFVLKYYCYLQITCICETNGTDHVKNLREDLVKIYQERFKLEAREAESTCSSGRCCAK